MEWMSFVFQVMLYVGIGLPLLNVILGVIGSVLGGGGADAGGDVKLDASGLELDMDAGGLDMDLDFDLDMELDLDIAEAGALAAELDLELGDMAEMGELAEAGSHTPTQARGPFVQFNIYCLCLSLVIMGAMGIFALSRPLQTPLLLALGAAGAIAGYILLYRLVIRPLRKNDAKPMRLDDLAYKHALVSIPIMKDGPGQIRTKDNVGAIISYRAELDPDICDVDRIETGEEVLITQVDKTSGACYVIPAQNKLLEVGGERK